MLLRFYIDQGMTVESVSKWFNAKGVEIGEFTEAVSGSISHLPDGQGSVLCDVGGWEIDGEVVDELLSPDGTTFSVLKGKWKFPSADRVKFISDDQAYVVTGDNGNPAGLKLSFTAKTGAFKGKFKVYSVTDKGQGRKRSATVGGIVLDGVGYGTAVLKNIGAVPVTVEPEE